LKILAVPELASQQPTAPAHNVDVRAFPEFATGHIPGAANIPMDERGIAPEGLRHAPSHRAGLSKWLARTL